MEGAASSWRRQRVHLNFHNATLPVAPGASLHLAHFCGTDDAQLYALSNASLTALRWQPVTHRWTHAWTAPLACHSPLVAPYFIPRRGDDAGGLLVLKTSKGLTFYTCDDGDKLELVSQTEQFDENQFHDILGWDAAGSAMALGTFYHDANLVGLAGFREKTGLEFHAVDYEALKSGQYPMAQLQVSPPAARAALDAVGGNVQLSVVDALGDGDALVVRSRAGVRVLAFDADLEPRVALRTPLCATPAHGRRDALLFARLAGGGVRRDMVQVNATGMFVFRRAEGDAGYRMLQHSARFAEGSGWREEHVRSLRAMDVGGDEKEEVVFTGPQGVDVFALTSDGRLESVLETAQLKIEEKYGAVLHAVPASHLMARAQLFASYENKLRWADVEDLDLKPMIDSTTLPGETSHWQCKDESANSKILQVGSNHKNLREVLLRDQLDWKPLLNPVDRLTGKVKFSLPLFGVRGPISKLALFYNGGNSAADIVGKGWFMSKNVIFLDNKSSVFPEDETYYLIFQNTPYELKHVKDKSGNGVAVFTADAKEELGNVRASHFVGAERWEVLIAGTTFTFGRPASGTGPLEADGIRWALAWNNWRGNGNAATNRLPIAVEWHLTRAEDKFGNAVDYTYAVDNRVVSGGLKLPRGVYLKSVRENQGNLITFDYASKLPVEYTEPRSTDNFIDSSPVISKYLAGYSFVSNSQQMEQVVRFSYEVRDSERLLVAVQQESNGVFQDVVNFTYGGLESKAAMIGIFLPANVSVALEYEPRGTGGELDPGQRYVSQGHSHRVDYGAGFMLVSFISDVHGKVMLVLLDAVGKELYSSDILTNPTSEQFLLFGQGKVIKSHEIVLADELIAVLLDYEDAREVCLIHGQGIKWKTTSSCFEYDNVTMVRFAPDCMVTNKNGVEVIEWNPKLYRWERKQVTIGFKTTPLIAASHRVILAYDDESIWLGRRDDLQAWRFAPIKRLPGAVSGTVNTFQRFHLANKAISDALVDNMKLSAFQLNRNSIVLRSVVLRGTKMLAEVNTMTIGGNYQIASHSKFDVEIHDLRKVGQVIEMTNNENKSSSFRVGYQVVNGNVKIVVGSFGGAIKEAIDGLHISLRNNATLEMKNSFEKRLEEQSAFLLETSPYHVMPVDLQTVMCNGTEIQFNGDQWLKKPSKHISKEKTSLSMQLADKHILQKQNDSSSIHLYKQDLNGNPQGPSLLDLEIKDMKGILNRYPLYLAYQKDGNQLYTIVEFLKDSEDFNVISLLGHEVVSAWSGAYALVSEDAWPSGTRSTTLIVRPMLGLRRLLPDHVVRSAALRFAGGRERVAGYNYDAKSAHAFDDTVFYEKVTQVPGNKKDTYGWSEDFVSFKNESLSSFSAYSSTGELLRTVHSKNEPSKNEADETIRQSCILFDKSGEHEIAEFFPFPLKQGEVGYLGFEDYESNPKLDGGLAQVQWSFDESDVVRTGFPLTGKNYLQLSGSGTSILAGEFPIESQSIDFIASCWLRSSSALSIGDVSPFLKAYVSTDGGAQLVTLPSEVKYQLLDWFFLEVIVDMTLVKSIRATLLPVGAKEMVSENLRVNIKVSPGSYQTIQVDNVKFSPVLLLSPIRVYDAASWLVTEEIAPTGLITRIRYDHKQREVFRVDENQNLEPLGMFTKSWNESQLYPEKCHILLIPDEGFYERFDAMSFASHWLADHPDAWHFSLGQLRHSKPTWASIKTKDVTKTDSAAIRFSFSLNKDQSSVRMAPFFEIKRTGNTTELSGSGKPAIEVPSHADVLFVLDHDRFFVWVDARLYLDESAGDIAGGFSIGALGDVVIDTVVVMSQVRVTLTYMNALAEKVQLIQLEHAHASVVTHYLYDALGRQDITTPPLRIARAPGRSILAYQEQLVTNDNPGLKDSVWHTGRLSGQVNTLRPDLDGYVYTRTTYNDNPLDEEATKGLPGQEFSIDGPFSKQVSGEVNVELLKQMFPRTKGYSYRTELATGGIEEVSVFDLEGNRIALYTQSPRTPGLLSTYEFDGENRLTVMLPPMYHQEAHTARNVTSFFHPSEDDNKLRATLGTFKSYDADGNLILHSSPDSGKIEFLYNEERQLQFVAHVNARNETHRVVYNGYDNFNRLLTSSSLHPPPSREGLIELLDKQVNSTEILRYQKFVYNDAAREPLLRYAMKRSVTIYGGEPYVEESIINTKESEISSRVLMPANNRFSPSLLAIDRKYIQTKLRATSYPMSVQGVPLTLKIDYTKLGEIAKIYMAGRQEQPLVAFTYRADGQVQTEQHVPGSPHAFTRRYSHNGPGFLTRLEDKFFTEELSYTDGSYGGQERGDGTVYHTAFTADWHGFCDKRQLGLTKASLESEGFSRGDAVTCLRALKEAGYLDELNRQKKIYFASLESHMPIVCSAGVRGRKIASALGKSGFPKSYGYRFDYGIQNELTKASYFITSEEMARSPLQPNSFSDQIKSLTKNESHRIWDILAEFGFLYEARLSEDFSFAHGKRGKSLIRQTLMKDLQNIERKFGGIYTGLSNVMLSLLSQKKTLKKSELASLIQKWNPHSKSAKDADLLMKMLETKGYVSNALDEQLVSGLSAFSKHLPDIVGVLHRHFGRELGESEHDVESYDIDAHGNHKQFYTGFHRYQLQYPKNSNQVDKVLHNSFSQSKGEVAFTMKHDDSGNVVQALHKGIESILYHPASNRPTEIRMTSKITVTFGYDAQGERVLKRVFSANGDLKLEVQYLRDKLGRCLMETRLSFVEPHLPADVLTTVYVYGKSSLVGFFRRDAFHSVVTDHEGSTRLVVREGEVVAAYDYLPYGQQMRSFGASPEAHISYRYTGQEWDEETGLYNYHARMYDPDIGRFYQIDPQEQYFSPYMYAGNSPVSLIDPDGELALTILALIIGGIGAVVGGYLGAAKYNNTFNPLKWRWNEGGTWLGFGLGALGGSTLALPTSFVGAAAFFGLGIPFAYFGAASAAGSWNPAKWDFSKPAVWDGLFQGLTFGASFLGGAANAVSVFSSLSKPFKVVFAGGTLTALGFSIYSAGTATDWDVSSPTFWFGITKGVLTATDAPILLNSIGRTLQSVPKLVKSIGKDFTGGLRTHYLPTITFKTLWINNLETGSNFPLIKIVIQTKPRIFPLPPFLESRRSLVYLLGQINLNVPGIIPKPDDHTDETDQSDQPLIPVRTIRKRVANIVKELKEINMYLIEVDLSDLLLVIDRKGGRHNIFPKYEKTQPNSIRDARNENDLLFAILEGIKTKIKEENIREFKKSTQGELHKLLDTVGLNFEGFSNVVPKITTLFSKEGCISSKSISSLFAESLSGGPTPALCTKQLQRVSSVQAENKDTDTNKQSIAGATNGQIYREGLINTNHFLDKQIKLAELSNLFARSLEEYSRRFEDWSPKRECSLSVLAPSKTPDDGLARAAYETSSVDQCSARDCHSCVQSSASLSRSMDAAWLQIKEPEKQAASPSKAPPRNEKKNRVQVRKKPARKDRAVDDFPAAVSSGNQVNSWILSTISFVKQNAKKMFLSIDNVGHKTTARASSNPSLLVQREALFPWPSADRLTSSSWQEAASAPTWPVERVDVHGSLLLADLVARKVTGETRCVCAETGVSEHDALAAALSITARLECAVRRVAKRACVPERVRRGVEFYRAQGRAQELVMSGRWEGLQAALLAVVVGSNEELAANAMFVAEIDESIADILLAWRA